MKADSLFADSLSAGAMPAEWLTAVTPYTDSVAGMPPPATPFRPDSVYLLHHGAADGMVGTPLPYNVRSDNTLTLVLLLAFVLFAVALSRSMHSVALLTKDFFRSPHGDADNVPHAYSPFLLFLVLLNSLLQGVISYIFATDFLSRHFMLESQALVVFLLFGLFVAYYAVRWGLYGLVNSVFFGSKKTLQWSHAFLYITAVEGVLLFPLVFLLVYFDLAVENALFVYGFVLFLNKMLTFYKCWFIFFRQNGFTLQIFLYFCALEITPLLAFVGVWLTTINSLKVNF